MSEYRPIAPSATRGGGPPRSPEGAPPRRRRVTGQVSQLACNECRRTRSKCDGERPHRCGRCSARGLSCIYEPHTKTQKNDLLRELNRAHEREKSLQETSANSEIILDIIRHDGHVDEVIERLRHGQTHSDIVDWLHTLEDVRARISISPNFQESMLEVVQRIENLFAMPDQKTLDQSIAAKWTKVTPNTELLRHLFELYFAWVHPHHYLFAEVDMLDSFYAGKDTYCSEALVNAICAMACHLLEAPGPVAQSMNAQDIWSLQEAFVQEARSHLKPHVQMDLLSLQAMSVIALIEFSHGRARNGVTYLRFTSEEVAHVELPTHGEPVTRMHPQIVHVSKWGITTLAVIWKILTYQNHTFPASSSDETELIGAAVQERPWTLYRQKDDALERARRPAFSALTARHMARLAQCGKAMVDLYSGYHGNLHADQILDVYRRFRDWKRLLPQELSISNLKDSDKVLPHICASHVLYNATIVQLWAPLLLATPPLSPTARSGLHQQILGSAREGIRLVEYLHRNNVTRYSMPTVAFSICHLGETIVRYSEFRDERVSALVLILEVLQKNRTGFQVCGPLAQILRANASEIGLDLTEILPINLRSDEEFDIDAILNCTTRMTFTQPVKQMSRWLAPELNQEWPAAWQELEDEEVRTKAKPMRVTDLLNS